MAKNAFVLFLALGSVAMGCGGDDAEGSSSGATSGDATTTTSTGSGEGGKGGSGGSGATTSGTGGGAATGTGGSGGEGGSVTPECTAGSKESCYSGPAGTEGVGVCHAGERTCNADGTWGLCVGEIPPQQENCTFMTDEDCDGLVNESGAGCNCVPGTTQSCFGGPPLSENVGICLAGTQTCAADGVSWEDCLGDVLPVIENCLFAEDEDCNGVSEACTGTYQWAKGFGDAKAQVPKGVAAMPGGGAAITGSFQGTVDFGGGGLVSAGAANNDIYLAVFDYLGAHMWSKRFGDSGAAQNGTAVAVDSQGNVIITGDIAGTTDFGGGGLTSAGVADFFIAKFDKDGNHLWSHIAGDSKAQNGLALAVGPNDEIAVSGSFVGGMDFNGAAITNGTGASTDAFVAVYDKDGNIMWAKGFGDASAQSARGVSIAPNGDVVIVGDLAGTIDFGGGGLTSAGGTDIFLARFASDGSYLNAKIYGKTMNQSGIAVTTDSVGNMIVLGDVAGKINFGGADLSSAGSTDVLVAKFAADFTPTFNKLYGDASAQNGKAIAVDALDAMLVTGDFAGTINFGGGAMTTAGSTDLFVVKLDPLGGPVWQKQVGDSAAQLGAGIAASITNVYVSGSFQGTINVGGANMTTAGSTDVLLWLMSP